MIDAAMPWAVLDDGSQREVERLPLFGVAATRELETEAACTLPPHTLMQRAGGSVARLALALAPHARRIWIAAGPRNNGGDGLEAAAWLQRAGKQVTVGWAPSAPPPADAAAAGARARAAGVTLVESSTPPAPLGPDDLAIDALFGIGLTRAPAGWALAALRSLNDGLAPVLSIDLPSGLDAEQGSLLDENAAVQACWTLSLLTLKPGLFTAQGRDHAGQVWFHDLGVHADATRASAGLLTGARALWPARRHAQHKGSFGDVWVVGGAAGMAGAALLAARAALAAGAGRVHLVPLEPQSPALDPMHPELMHRRLAALHDARTPLENATVVCGCGGGDAVREHLPGLIARAGRLLLDADALNSVATDPSLARLLDMRAGRGRATLLTPHPLEAARLLGLQTAAVQSARLSAADRLAQRWHATVVLKGSGSVIAAPGETTLINASGNASLATAGTGDVLAGWIGGLWAQGLSARNAALLGTHTHGAAADAWCTRQAHPGPVAASALIAQLRR
ncbi:NAD(P)H-hydrate dehydratase [Methylibium sp.]|uniref:NAD(P)H-hydrate dehydratase n=1 Tax=Methylibium sp. TaxID=2067992 RepID=UPI003BACCD81